jgi:outer membrane murein-binding lipoprotein Lpp
MGEKTSDFEEETTSIVKIEEMSLEESQLAEQLYNSAGLGPVVEAGLKDYDKELRKEDKLISKVFGARSSDIRSYGEAVAKRVAFAVYTLLNKQYGGKVGDLRSYIMTLQDERDRANVRYDELMGRVVGILGEEYKDLRTDSKEFMERLTTILGEDLKESKIDKKELAEKLADIDGLRSKIRTLEEEKVQLTEKHESRVTSLQNEHEEEIGNLRSQISELDSKVKGLESEKTALAGDLEQLREDHEQLKKAMMNLAATIPDEGIGKKLRDELYGFILEDSKVPDRVIGGVGKFIDFKKYLGLAAERGAKEVCKRIEGTVGTNS